MESGAIGMDFDSIISRMYEDYKRYGMVGHYFSIDIIHQMQDRKIKSMVVYGKDGDKVEFIMV